MTSDLQQTRYDKLVRRVGGIIGPGSKVSEALPELFPTLDVENVPGELLILMGTRIAFGGGSVGPTVGQSGSGQLFNPADSGKLITITNVIASSRLNAGPIRWGLTGVAFPLHLATQVYRDTREGFVGLPSGQIRTQDAVALASGTNQSDLNSRDPLYLNDPNGICVLTEGTGFEIGTASQNAQFFFSISWRERDALSSELNLPG